MPQIAAIVWQELYLSDWFERTIGAPWLEHLLGCFLFLKNYSTEEIHATIVRTSEKTFWKWVWFFAEGIANLDRKFVRSHSLHAPVGVLQLLCCHLQLLACSSHSIFISFLRSLQIRWANWLRGNTGERCLIIIDGVNFAIQGPKPFSAGWYSHKFSGLGIRYELASCIHTGDIVSFTGPFKCGKWPDILIF
jgi:hypothetical protein